MLAFKNFMDKRAFQKKSIVLSWFVSYIIILIATIFVNLFIYSETQASLTRQIHATSAENLENRRQYIDNMQQNFQNTVSELAQDKTIQNILSENTVDGNYRYALLAVQNQLYTRKVLNSNISKLYIYFHDTDYVVTTSMAQKTEKFYNQNYKNKEMGLDGFLQLMQRKNAGVFEKIADEGQDTKGADLLFLFSVYGTELFAPKATIVCEISNKSLITPNDFDMSGRYFCIVDRDNRVILSNAGDSSAASEALSEVLLTSPGTPVIAKKAVALYTLSKQNDWKYAYIVEKDEYLKELKRVRLIIFVTVLLCVALGIALAYYLSVRNHKPIRKLIEQLGVKDMQADNGGKTENEFQMIDRRLSEILESNELQNSKIASQNVILRDAVFAKLLNNETVSEVSMEELLSSIDVSFSEPNFALIAFYFEEISGLFFEEKKGRKEEDIKLSKLIVSNILDDILGGDYTKVFCDINGVFSCIVNTSNSKCEENLRKALDSLLEFTQNNFNLGFMACISQVHEGIEGLAVCQKEVAECLEYKFILGNEIISYRDVSETQTNLYYFPIGQEVQMISSLKNGDYEKSLEILNKIFEVNLSQAKPQLQTAKCLVYDILGSVMKVLNDIGEIDGNNIFERFNVFERIDKCYTVLSIKDELISIFKEICEKSMNESVEKTNRMIESVKNFIESYYDDPNLSGAMISDHFKINQSYLSTIFKRNTSQGLLEYIAKTRVQKAISLLRETSDTVEKIAEKVGYVNVRTFSRTFKKYAGETPGKYREMEKRM